MTTGDPPHIDASQIAPRLWVGAAPDNVDQKSGARQADLLATNSALGLVIDCRLGADDRAIWAHRREVTYVNVGVDDAGKPLPDDFFTEGVELVFSHWARARCGVLIHCESGSHRSPALALAVLLADGLEFDDAVRRLVAARPAVRDRYFADAARWHLSYTT